MKLKTRVEIYEKKNANRKMTWFACCGAPTFFQPSDDETSESMWERWWPRALTAEESLKKWQAELRREKRTLLRALPAIHRARNKTKLELKATETNNKPADAETHRQTLKMHDKAEKRIIEAGAKIDTLLSELRKQAGVARLSRAFATSNEVMVMLGQMMRLPELRETARKLGVSMTQAGLVDDVIDVALDDEQEDSQLDKAAEAHVAKVVAEVVEEIKKVPVANDDLESEYTSLGASNTTEADLQARLQKLKSPGTAMMEE